MKEAMFYEKLDGRGVKCFLCMHHCSIGQGRRGICGVRENLEGTLYSLAYGKLVSMNIDPIEKKPLYHFLPGSRSFSIATVGCNFKCLHCQNYDISQYPKTENDIPGEVVTPEEVVAAAEKAGCESISYTYTEPTIFFEFSFDCARLAHKRGIKNIFVSNGYTSPEAVEAIAPFLDANNIDLKGDDVFYRKVCGARLQPVLDTIRLMKSLGVWIEITTLVIEGYNDSDESLNNIADFIKSVDAAVPWHVTKFCPTYRLLDSPHTSVKTLKRARESGIKRGLKFVYQGNLPGEGDENTYCPVCGELLIERFGFQLRQNRIENGHCFKCMTEIEGIWR